MLDLSPRFPQPSIHRRRFLAALGIAPACLSGLLTGCGAGDDGPPSVGPAPEQVLVATVAPLPSVQVTLRVCVALAEQVEDHAPQALTLTARLSLVAGFAPAAEQKLSATVAPSLRRQPTARLREPLRPPLVIDQALHGPLFQL